MKFNKKILKSGLRLITALLLTCVPFVLYNLAQKEYGTVLYSSSLKPLLRKQRKEMPMSSGNVRLITSGQKFELAAALVKAVPELDSMPFETARRWIGDQKAIACALSQALMPAEVVGAQKTILRLIPGAEALTLGPTDGQATIAESRGVFNNVDPGFTTWGTNVPGVATGEIAVSVYELVADASFEQMFGSLPARLGALCLTQAQIIKFVLTRQRHLRTDGYATFFLFEVGSEFFVAHVYLPAGGDPHVHFYRLSGAFGWHREHRHRIVVPQLTPARPGILPPARFSASNP